MMLQHTTKEVDLLGRLIRAEAVGEGELGMLMVGNVIINRAIADCLTFRNVRTIYDVMYQPNQFSGVKSPLFQSAATTKEKELADRVIKGHYFYPATNSLWFYAPSGTASCRSTWYDQALAGRFKSHCFYKPSPSVCAQIH